MQNVAKFHKRFASINRGLTLIELLIAISIASVVTGVVILMLMAGFDSYLFGQQEVLLEKALDEYLGEVTSGSFEEYGIKDSLEILDITHTSVTFVPLWVDDSHRLKPEHQHPELATETAFILNRPFKPGSTLPIAEFSEAERRRGAMRKWKIIPITFVSGSREEPRKPNDKVFLKGPLEFGSKIRFMFQPDATHFSDSAMTIFWNGDKLTRAYKGKTEIIPKYKITGVRLSNFKLQYFDNTNTEVETKKDYIPNITAVKVSIEVSLDSKTKLKQPTSKVGYAFVNLRNTRTAGRGLIIQKDTRIKIPDSKHIRVFGISNVVGIKEGGIIELEARPESGMSWRVRMELGLDNKKPVIRRYSVEYPPGTTVYSETVNLTTDIPLNFMNLGFNGLYDYDFDKGRANMVDLEGDVELVVTEMDAAGAALFIRP